MKYHGYGRFIVHRVDNEFEKYELLHSEITQFGHTVPYRVKDIQNRTKGSLNLIQLGEALKQKDKRAKVGAIPNRTSRTFFEIARH